LESIYKKLRERYRPSKIDILFIAEAPPLPRDTSKPIPYFYNKDSDRPRGLYRRMAKALNLKGSKSEGLKQFRGRSMWLTDFFDEPLKTMQVERIEGHLNRLFREIEETHPRKIVTLLPNRKQNQVLLYFLKRQVPPDVRIFSTNPWRGTEENLRKFLVNVLAVL